MLANKERPIAIGATDERIGSKAVMRSMRGKATQECGSLQVCTGVRGGIDALVHATDRLYEQFQQGCESSAPQAGGYEEPAAAGADPGSDDDADVDPWG